MMPTPEMLSKPVQSLNQDYDVWKVGMRVYVLREIDLRPYTVLTVGQAGTVVESNAVEGVEVLMDDLHPGLGSWHNCALLVGPALQRLRPIPPACAVCPQFPLQELPQVIATLAANVEGLIIEEQGKTPLCP